MPHVAQPQGRPAKTLAAIVLFVVVYLGVIAFVVAPKGVLTVQSPTAVLDTD